MAPVAAKTIDPYYIPKHPIYTGVATTTGPARIVTTAGQIGQDENGKLNPDYEKQVAQAFKNLSRCLEAAGATVKDVMKLTYYVALSRNPEQCWMGLTV